MKLSCWGQSTRNTYLDQPSDMSGVNHSDKPPSYSAGPVDTTQRLQQLRALFQDHKIDCYVVPSGDAHGSEYVAPKDKRQRFISGFTGEASTAIIDSTRAALFVDGRYHVQAAKEIDRNWTLYKVGLEDVPTWTEYLEVRDCSHAPASGHSRQYPTMRLRASDMQYTTETRHGNTRCPRCHAV